MMIVVMKAVAFARVTVGKVIFSCYNNEGNDGHACMNWHLTSISIETSAAATAPAVAGVPTLCLSCWAGSGVQHIDGCNTGALSSIEYR